MLALMIIRSAPSASIVLDLGAVLLGALDVLVEHRLGLLGVAVGAEEALPGGAVLPDSRP